MGKLIPVLFAGAGTAAVSVGGVYLLNSGSNYADMGFMTLADFKKHKGGSFTQEFFGQVSFDTAASSGNPAQVDSSSNKVEASYLDGTTGEEKSSLVVNWERYNPSPQTTDQKWLGDFDVLWNVAKGNKGFTMFLAAHPAGEDKKLSLEGGIYFLEKSGNPAVWSVKKYKELDNQTLSKSEFDNKFPKAKDEVKKGVDAKDENHKPLWGFVGTKDDLDKAAKKETGTQTANRRHLHAKWMWKPDSTKSKTMVDWSENLETWANQLFTSTDVELKCIVEQMKGT